MTTKTRIALAALLFAPFAAVAATHPVELTLAVENAEVSLENLAGTMTVTVADGDAIVIEAERVGATDALATGVTLEHRRRGDTLEIWFEYPSDDIVYKSERWSGNTTTRYRGDRVKVSGRGRGDEVHVNVRVAVPRGTEFSAYNAVGRMDASGLEGDVELRAASGHISAQNLNGELELSSGSGRLELSHFEGELEAKTGSGRITLANVTGEVEATTGSGGIEATVVGGNVAMKTGSGSIRVSELAGGNAFRATTGSGSIRVDGDLSKVTDLNLRTGSGSIRIDATDAPNVKLVARTGSGSVDVDLPNMSNVSAKRNRVEATIGTGEGEASLRTGSGSIRFQIKR